MKQLSTRTIAIIALVAVAVLAIGVFAIQDHTKTPTQVVENGEGPENQEGQLRNEVVSSTSLQDLVENSETITLPEIDTSTWSGHYQSEDLGIEFDYPQEEEWFIRDDLFTNSVCIGTAKYDYEVFIEGEGECIIQISKAMFRGETSVERIEMKIVEELQNYYKYQNVKLPFFDKNAVIADESSIFIREGNLFLVIRFSQFTNNQDIKNIFYGVLQTLKPLSE